MTNVESEKYKGLMMSGSRCLAFTGVLKHEDITSKIDYVKVWSRQNSVNVIKCGSNNIIGAIVSGVMGAIASAIVNMNNVTVTCTVFLLDGNYFTVETDDKALLTYLTQYTHVGRKYSVRGQAV